MFKKKKEIIILTTFLGLFSLTSCDMTRYGQEVAEGVITGLIPNFWAFLIQLLALLVLVGGVFLLGYKPLKKYLDSRSESIDNEIKSAQKDNILAKNNLNESEKIMSDSKKEALKIIEDAKESANIEREEILKHADAEAQNIRESVKLDIKKQKEAAKKDVENEIINVALDASKHILDRELNEADNDKIVDDFIKEIKKEKKNK